MADQNVQNWKATLLDSLKTIVLPLVVVFLTEPLYRKPLYEESLKLTPEIQTYDSWKPFMLFVSALGTGKIYASFTAISFNLIPKPAALYLWSGIAFASYTNN